MKKFLALTLTALMLATLCLGLASCGGGSPFSKNSGLTLDAFTATMQDVDDELALTLEGDRYVYSETGIFAYSYSVACDDDGYVTDVEIKTEQINASDISTSSKIITIASKSSGSMTMADVRVVSAVLRVGNVIEAAGISSDDITTAEVVDLISQQGSNTYGDWTVSVRLNGTTLVINATYNN